MNAAKRTGYLLLLAAIGVLAFALFGAIYSARTGKPMELQAEVSAAAAPAASMRTGATASLRKATEALGDGRRSEATHAMDAALRVLEVGTEAFGGVWHEAAKETKRAKRAMSNGVPGAAAEALHGAMKKLRTASGGSEAGEMTKPRHKYQGAMLVNAAGVRIGELTAVGDAGGSSRLALGGERNLFGFWDLGGEEVEVPTGRLVFGPSQWPKSTLVLAPTLASEPDAVTADLQQGR